MNSDYYGLKIFLVAAVLGGGSSGSGGVVTSSGKPYISTLSQPDLERLGLKAVSAGAKPEKLQQAFVSAQTNGDWSKLENLISGALGEDAVKDPSAGNPIAAVSNIVSNFIGRFTPTFISIIEFGRKKTIMKAYTHRTYFLLYYGFRWHWKLSY